MTEFTPAQISKRIYFIRGLRVMLDVDLANLYGVKTGALNRAVRRNQVRFPSDFMFQLTENEEEFLRCQIGISKMKLAGASPAVSWAPGDELVPSLGRV